jgi:hypothetical protein
VDVLPAPLDFRHLTPLEYLSLADRERIHTETLRWLFSDDSPLGETNRLEVLEQLAARKFPDATIFGATTEEKNLDLIVKLDWAGQPHYVAIENKLKTAEHSSQLAGYDVYLASLGNCTRLFLTLVGEPPVSSSKWESVSYARLHDAVQLARPIRNVEYVSDYELMLRRLVGAVDRVILTPDSYAGNGAVFDSALGTPAGDFDEFATYIKRMRLRTILQQAWMRALGVAILSSQEVLVETWHVGETRGSALLHFTLAWFQDDGRTYEVGVQLQNWVFKVFCAPSPYLRGALQEQHEVVERTLVLLRNRLGLAQARFTHAREFGFRSFSAGDLAPKGTLSIGAWSQAFTRVIQRVNEVVSTV